MSGLLSVLLRENSVLALAQVQNRHNLKDHFIKLKHFASQSPTDVFKKKLRH